MLEQYTPELREPKRKEARGRKGEWGAMSHDALTGPGGTGNVMVFLTCITCRTIGAPAPLHGSLCNLCVCKFQKQKQYCHFQLSCLLLVDDVALCGGCLVRQQHTLAMHTLCIIDGSNYHGWTSSRRITLPTSWSRTPSTTSRTKSAPITGSMAPICLFCS